MRYFKQLFIICALLTGTSTSVFAQFVWTTKIVGSVRFVSVTWTGSQLVAITNTTDTVQTSPDGVTWTARKTGRGPGLFEVTWANNQLVAVGQSGLILTSPDGITWTTRTSGVTRTLYSVTWTGPSAGPGTGLLVVGGAGRTILTSPDGITWTPRPLAVGSGTFLSIKWNGSQLIAVGSSGIVATSPDAVTWTVQTSVANSPDLESVTWAGPSTGSGTGLWVATGGNNGYVWTSTNGTTWTVQTGPTKYMYSVTWTGSQVVAVGSQTISTTPDGVTWTNQDLGVQGNGLESVISTGTQVVAVGSVIYGPGAIMTSPIVGTGIAFHTHGKNISALRGQDLRADIYTTDGKRIFNALSRGVYYLAR